MFHRDRFDYDQHDLGKAWKEGFGVWLYERVVRHTAIDILRAYHNVDEKFGFDMIPYGYGQIHLKNPHMVPDWNQPH
jgi:hypothetical protein